MHVFIDFWKLETENSFLHVFSFLYKLNFDGISKTLTLKIVLYDHIAIKKTSDFLLRAPKTTICWCNYYCPVFNMILVNSFSISFSLNNTTYTRTTPLITRKEDLDQTIENVPGMGGLVRRQDLSPVCRQPIKNPLLQLFIEESKTMTQAFGTHT